MGFDRIGEPLGLSYDVNTHHLWVGSKNKKVFIYKYIERENTRKDEDTSCFEELDVPISRPAPE